MIVRELQTLLSFKTDGRGAGEYDQQLSRLRNAAAAAAAAIAASFGAGRLVKAGDDLTTSMNRLGVSTSGPAEAAAAYEDLYSSARETGVAVVDSTKAFMRFAPAMAKLGYSSSDAVSVIDGLQKGLLAAGSTAAETTSVFLQLGQAVNANNFAGDELKAFLENSSPTIVNAMAEALGTTAEKLKELGSEGKLTNQNVLPALLAAAKAGRDEFGKMRVTVELAMARSRVALDRLLAEFDRAFQITEKLGLMIQDVGNRFDEWRSRLPIIREFIDSLGGMERIAAALALGIIYVGSVVAALNGTLSATIARVAVLSAGFLAVVAAGLLLQDFFAWMRGDGTKTLFGKMFGDFDKAVGPMLPAIDEMKARLLDVKALFLGTPDEAIQAWGRLKKYLSTFLDDTFREWPEWAKAIAGVGGKTVQGAAQELTPSASTMDRGKAAVAEAYRIDDMAPLGQFLRETFRGAIGSLAPPPASPSVPQDNAKSFVDILRDALGSIGFRQQVQQPDGGLLLINPGESMGEAMRRSAAGSTTSVSATQTNTINLGGVTVNATGPANAETAAAAQAGVGRAAASLAPAQGDLARQLRGAIPGVEGAGGVQGGLQ